MSAGHSITSFMGLGVVVMLLSPVFAQNQYDPRPMMPSPIEQTENAGLDEGMSLFPADVPGFPGTGDRPDWGKWGHPERQNYPGSVEHFRVDSQHYMHPINFFNHRTLVTNFIAVEMDGAKPEMREQFAEPIQYVGRGVPAYSGKTRPPVPVVRLKPGGARLSFHFDPLPTGLYVVRMIGAIESENVVESIPDRLPKGLVLDLMINDGPNGEVNHYAIRQRGTDNFYGLGDFFFRSVDGRAYNASVGLHADSQIDLLVHNVDVHDVLAECAKQAGKRESILVNWDSVRANWPADPNTLLGLAKAGQWADLYKTAPVDTVDRLRALRAEFPDRPDADLLRVWRERRDDTIWNALPPINLNFHSYGFEGWKPKSSTDPITAARLEEAGLTYNFSATAWGNRRGKNATGPWEFDSSGVESFDAPWRFVKPLPAGGRDYYTNEDLSLNRPFPDLPFEVHSWGRRFEGEDGTAYYFFPIAEAVGGTMHKALVMVGGRELSPGVNKFLSRGDMDAARDTSLLLCRVAYDLPTYSTSHSLFNVLTPPSGFYGRLIAHQQRYRHYQFFEWTALARTYDQLFPFIQGNLELAEAVGKHISWVKTPDDVITLLDTYIVQYGAREMMYYQSYYDHAHAAQLATLAAIQSNPEISHPWVKFIFSNTWEYPLPYASIEDYIYLTTQRDGTQTIGSSFYTLAGGIGGRTAPWLDYYIKYGGDPKYSLSNIKLYPRVGVFPYFVLEHRVAGMHPPGIGDVGGPNVQYGQWWDGGSVWMNRGWAWTNDPRFAWCVVNYGQRRNESDAEWATLQAAAQLVERNPYMANRSRILSDWGGILEGGTSSDDFRFRHAARVRVGRGTGHAHNDTLDLGIWSLGLTMSGDGGARPGYARPGTANSIIHNLVTIDRQDWMGHAWAPELADMPSTQYINVVAQRGEEYSRQTALIELDHGTPSAQRPSNANLQPGTRYGNDVTLPKAYFVDVFRTIGGKQHMYNFHGPAEDEFSVNVTKGALTPDESQWMEAPMVYVMEGEQWGATIDQNVLTATWRMAREGKVFDMPGRGQRRMPAVEPAIMGQSYDPGSPRKYLRVHVPGQDGQRVVSGVLVSGSGEEGRSEGEWLRHVHVMRDGGTSMFAAVWEPFAGAPFIQNVRMTGDPNNARGPVAMYIDVAGDIKDIVFMDHAADVAQTLEGGVRVQGKYAYISRDQKGLRSVNLVGGKMLAADGFTIMPASDFWEARATRIDWLEKTAWMDSPLPAELLDGTFFEITAEMNGQTVRSTTFEAAKVEPLDDGAVLVWKKGADCHSSKVMAIETVAQHRDANRNAYYLNQIPDDHIVLTLEFAANLVAGENRQLVVASQNGDVTTRCNAVNAHLICGAGVNLDSFKIGERVGLYQIGVGDVFRAPTNVSLTREATAWRIDANTPCKILIQAERAQWSTDGRLWTDVPVVDGARIMSVSAKQLASGPVYLR